MEWLQLCPHMAPIWPNNFDLFMVRSPSQQRKTRARKTSSGSGATPSPGQLAQNDIGFLGHWRKGRSPHWLTQSPWDPEEKLLFRALSQLHPQRENFCTSFLFLNSILNILVYYSGRNHGNPTLWQFVFPFLYASLLGGSRNCQYLTVSGTFCGWEWSHDPAQVSETKENLQWGSWFLAKSSPCPPNFVCIQAVLTT